MDSLRRTVATVNVLDFLWIEADLLDVASL